MTIWKITIAWTLKCLFLFYVASDAALGPLDEKIGRISKIVLAGGRRLQQQSTPCPHEFGFDNYTIVTSACPEVSNFRQAINYPRKQCCSALASMLCPYADYINDPNSDCNDSFWSYMRFAGNYTQGFFAFICTDTNSPQGMPCPDPTAASPDYSSARSGWTLTGLFLLVFFFSFFSNPR